MKRIIPFLFLLSSCQFFPEKLTCPDDMNINNVIHVINNSDMPLRCLRVEIDDNNEWAYSKGFEVGPHSSKYLKSCSYDNRYACSILLDQESSTMQTWIKPYMPGKYQVSLQEVPCTRCEKNKTKLATVITFPDGATVFNEY